MCKIVQEHLWPIFGNFWDEELTESETNSVPENFFLFFFSTSFFFWREKVFWLVGQTFDGNDDVDVDDVDDDDDDVEVDDDDDDWFPRIFFRQSFGELRLGADSLQPFRCVSIFCVL